MAASDVPYDASGVAGHPRGLLTLALTEMWERMSYYGMRALLILFMTAPLAAGGLGLATDVAAGIYGMYTSAVYFTAIPGGWIADRLLGARQLRAVGRHPDRPRPLQHVRGPAAVLLRRPRPDRAGHGPAEAQHQRDRRPALLAPRTSGATPASRSSTWASTWVPLLGPIVCGLARREGRLALGLRRRRHRHDVRHRPVRLGRRRFPGRGPRREPVEAPGRPVGAASSAACSRWRRSSTSSGTTRDWIMVIGTVALFVWFWTLSAPGVERKRLLAIIVLFVFATLFWGGFEQAGSSLNLFADALHRPRTCSGGRSRRALPVAELDLPRAARAGPHAAVAEARHARAVVAREVLLGAALHGARLPDRGRRGARLGPQPGGGQGEHLVAGRRLPLPHHRRAVPLPGRSQHRDQAGAGAPRRA